MGGGGLQAEEPQTRRVGPGCIRRGGSRGVHAGRGGKTRSFPAVGGVDTTVNGIAHLLLAFTEHPQEWDNLRADPRLIRRAVDESIRWDSTVQTFFRTASRDTEVAGHLIPRDSKVLLFLGSANRDPRKWDRPELFDLTRTTSGHVGFGAGIHQCLRKVIARLEAQIIVGVLAERCRSIRRTGEPVRRLNNTLHALASLPVNVQLA